MHIATKMAYEMHEQAYIKLHYEDKGTLEDKDINLTRSWPKRLSIQGSHSFTD